MTIDIDHFKLKAAPFRLTPDPEFWFESATHRKAMAYLGYGLALGEGFIVISGAIGAGKTTLLAHLLLTLDPARVEAIELRPENGDAATIWRQLGRALARSGVQGDGDDAGDVMAQISQRARMGKRLLIAVDEAQRLDDEALDQLRLASNACQDNQPVVQFLLLGQPELRETLARPALEQLAQRVIARHHLDVMEAGEIGFYVAHRLKMAGSHGNPSLGPGAVDALFNHSAGVPRRVNQLMSRLMLLAAISGTDTISKEMVELVVAEQSLEEGPRTSDNGSGMTMPGSGGSETRAALDHLGERVQALEARLHALEAALRQALHLLVDWAEGQPVRSQVETAELAD